MQTNHSFIHPYIQHQDIMGQCAHSGVRQNYIILGFWQLSWSSVFIYWKWWRRWNWPIIRAYKMLTIIIYRPYICSFTQSPSIYLFILLPPSSLPYSFPSFSTSPLIPNFLLSLFSYLPSFLPYTYLPIHPSIHLSSTPSCLPCLVLYARSWRLQKQRRHNPWLRGDPSLDEKTQLGLWL